MREESPPPPLPPSLTPSHPPALSPPRPPQVDYVIVPVGGAGLLAGVSLAIKTLRPECKVIGVEPKNCRSFQAALDHGKPVVADVAG